MNALKLIESFRALSSDRTRIAELKAELKALEKKEETMCKVLVTAIGDKAIRVDGKLLTTTDKPKGVRLGDQELIQEVMNYDLKTGEIVAQLAEEAKQRKAGENARNATKVLVVTDAPARVPGVLSLTVDANGQVSLTA